MNTLIVSLLVDAIRRQAVLIGYRTWTLLRLTCNALMNNMGDYHRFHEINIQIDDTTVTYDVFMDRLIGSMGRVSGLRSPYMRLFTVCIEQHDSPPRITGYRRRILEWSNDWLSVYDENGRRQHAFRRCMLQFDQPHIFIGDQCYVPEATSEAYLRATYSWIYDELPGLFSVMRIVKQISVSDINVV